MQGITEIWVDDTICALSESFSNEKDKGAKKVLNKGETSHDEAPVRFNGIELKLNKECENLIINQLRYI